MQLKTLASVGLLAISSAALAQMATQPSRTTGNRMMPSNSTTMNRMAPMPSATPAPMNTQDETMMNDSSMPDMMTPNSAMPPR